MFAVRNAPLQQSEEKITRAGVTVATIKPLYAVVNVCLTPRQEAPTHESKWFPAIIDTGNSHTFSLNEAQLTALGGRRITEFHYCGDSRVTSANGDEITVPRYNGNLWLRPDSGQPPLKIEFGRGFAYYPRSGPPVPLIGCRTLANAQLLLVVDYQRLRYSLLRFSQKFGAWLRGKGLLTEEQLTAALCQQASRRTTLDQLAVLKEPIKVVNILKGHCLPNHLGAVVAEIAVELGMMSAEDLSCLLACSNGASGSRIGELLVGLGLISQQVLDNELASYMNTLPQGSA